MSKNEAGTWQRHPFVISPWKGRVFVGGWLPDHESTPCCMARSFTSIQMFHTHTLSHTDTFTQRLLHTDTFTRRRFYTQTLLHTDTFTRRRFYTQTLFVYTHLLRTVIANSGVECILRAKNTSIKPDRKWLMTRGEKQCQGILSKSVLEATFPSKPSRYLPWQIAKTMQWKKEKQKPIVRHAGSWLSRLPLPKIGFAKSAGTSGWSIPISSQLMSSFVGSGLMSGPLPPALNGIMQTEPTRKIERRSFTSFQMVHTHALLTQGFFDTLTGKSRSDTVNW